MKVLVFCLIAILMLSGIIIFPQSVFAEEIHVTTKCTNKIITLTVSDSNGPLENASIHIYKDWGLSRYEGKAITDENGQADIEYTYRTNVAKITKGGHNDLTHALSCEDEFRNQSMKVFSTTESNVGIVKDPETGLTIIDLGTLFGIAGTGTQPDEIKVFQNNVPFSTLKKGIDISPVSANGEWQISQHFFTGLGNQGTYKLVLITNDEETYTFEFIVKQIGGTVLSRYLENDTEITQVTVDSAYLRIISLKSTEIPNRWVANIEYCVGKDSIIANPLVVFTTDLEIFEYVWQPVNENPGTCTQDSIEVMSVEYSNIIAFIPSLQIYSDFDPSIGIKFPEGIVSIIKNENEKLKNENEKLKNEILLIEEKLEGKDAIIMEQIKVIQQLAASLKKTIFEPIYHYFGFA